MADNLFDVGRLVSVLVIISLYLLKKRLPSKPVWLLFALECVIILSTCLNGGNPWSVVRSVLPFMSVVATIDFFTAYPAALIKELMLGLELIIYPNLLSIILTYPQGLYVRKANSGACYFLGYHNTFFPYVLLAVLISLLYLKIYQKKIRPFCLIAAGYFSILITWSATSIAALTLIGVLWLVPSQTVKRWVTFPKVFCITMTANLLISVFRIMDRVLWIAWWIEVVLKKQVTLTGRIYIWDLCYELIAQHPLLGYGTEADNITYSTLGVYSAHNFYLDLMIKGGIAAIVIYLLFSFALGKKLIQYHNSSICYIFLVVLTGLYAEFIAEACQYALIYAIMVLAYHVDKFEAVSVPATRRVRLVIKRGYHVPNRKLPKKY